jgi:hypothetical protein
MCRKTGLKGILTISSGFRTKFENVVVKGFCLHPSHNQKLNKKLQSISPTEYLINFEETMDTCPCCADTLLRHFDRGALYWFCRSCWAEMPSVEEYSAQLSIARLAAVKPHCVAQPQSNLVIAPPRQAVSGKYAPIAA